MQVVKVYSVNAETLKRLAERSFDIFGRPVDTHRLPENKPEFGSQENLVPLSRALEPVTKALLSMSINWCR